MAWRPVSAILVIFLALGGAAVALGPLGGECEDAHQHRYVGAVQGDMPTLLPEPMCPGEATLGLGGAFLTADHHKGPVCVSDLVLAEVNYSIARDGNGDGAITPEQAPRDGLVGPFRSGVCTLPPFPAGADGGWWVLIQGDATRGDISS